MFQIINWNKAMLYLQSFKFKNHFNNPFIISNFAK